MPASQSKRWWFTINNWVQDDVIRFVAFATNVKYIVWGKEIAPTTGTPHLQGFVIFNTNQRLAAVKRTIHPTAHFEIAKGTNLEASDYCKEDGDYEEYGEFPNVSGKNDRFKVFRDWVLEQLTRPSARTIALEFPGISIQYPHVTQWVDEIYPRLLVEMGEYRNY